MYQDGQAQESVTYEYEEAANGIFGMSNTNISGPVIYQQGFVNYGKTNINEQNTDYMQKNINENAEYNGQQKRNDNDMER